MSGTTRFHGSLAALTGGGVKRPFGLYAIALIQVLNALASGARALGLYEDAQIGSLTAATSDALATIVMVIGLVVAGGLLLLKRWAWVATMLWVGLLLASELVLYFGGGGPNYISLALSVAQVFYLNLSDVQGAFARRPAEPANDG